MIKKVSIVLILWKKKKKRKKERNFENFIKYWIDDNDYANSDVKVRDHCHITAEIVTLHRDCHIT